MARGARHRGRAAGALAATRVLTGLLFEVAPTDPLTFLATAATLLLVATLASLLPARNHPHRSGRGAEERMIDELIHDGRYALRSLAKAPGLTLIVLLTLALGIGANTAIFTVVNAVLLRPLPFAEPNRLVVVRETYGQGQTGSVSGPNFLDWRERSRDFAGMTAIRVSLRALVGDGEPEEIFTAMVTSDFFQVLGLAPVLGRGFAPAEDHGIGTVAVLSDGLWRSRYAADPGILGRSILLSGQPYTVIGVAPPGSSIPAGPAWRRSSSAWGARRTEPTTATT
jgi:hypothetical protein